MTDELATELFVELPNIVDTVTARNVEMSARSPSVVVGAEPLEQKPQRTSWRLKKDGKLLEVTAMKTPTGQLPPEDQLLLEESGRHIDADLIQSMGQASMGGCRPLGLARVRDETVRHSGRRSHDDVPEVRFNRGSELLRCAACIRNRVDMKINVDPWANLRALYSHVRVTIGREQSCKLFACTVAHG